MAAVLVRTWPAAGLLVALLLAGCSGSDKGTQEALGPDDDALGEACAIEGSVVDEADAPFVGATVTLIGNGAPPGTASDGDGRFAFGRVPVGPYIVQAVELGYEDAAEQVSCAAGASIEGLVLRLVPTPDVPQETFETQRRTEHGNVPAFWLTSYVVIGEANCGFAGAQKDIHYREYPLAVDEDTMFLNATLTWGPLLTSPRTVPDLNLCLYSADGVPRAWDLSTTSHPARMWINFTDVDQPGEWRVRVYCALGANVDYTLDLDVTTRVFVPA